MQEFTELERQYYVARMLATMDKMSNNGMWETDQRPLVPRLDSRTVIGQSTQESLSKR
ncbi:MAG: hypothetical protein H6765_10915 [Candidatus Peribacteria bacterium]|nr:MAG: hypothetical protein H6765_10915 [Candidatus Peribacteria bacterium]